MENPTILDHIHADLIPLILRYHIAIDSKAINRSIKNAKDEKIKNKLFKYPIDIHFMIRLDNLMISWPNSKLTICEFLGKLKTKIIQTCDKYHSKEIPFEHTCEWCSCRRAECLMMNNIGIIKYACNRCEFDPDLKLYSQEIDCILCETNRTEFNSGCHICHATQDKDYNIIKHWNNLQINTFHLCDYCLICVNDGKITHVT